MNASIADQVLERLDRQLAAAQRAVRDDPSASPVLAAVVEEFRRKYAKAERGIAGGEREPLVELEQAADSARYAALADVEAAEATRTAVVTAHDTICHFKTTGELLPE